MGDYVADDGDDDAAEVEAEVVDDGGDGDDLGD